MSFDETIIHCGAPALCGIKPASLFSMNGDCYKMNRQRLLNWQSDFSQSKRFFVPIKKDGNRFLFFVFDRVLLEKVLSRSENLEYLKSKGYQVEKGFDSILFELFRRLAYGAEFPHETGLFLGYPLEDVVGFETKGGRNCIYSGFWKVYGNKQAAINMMKLYKACTESCMNWLKSGLSVPLATKKYCSLGA